MIHDLSRGLFCGVVGPRRRRRLALGGEIAAAIQGFVVIGGTPEAGADVLI